MNCTHPKTIRCIALLLVILLFAMLFSGCGKSSNDAESALYQEELDAFFAAIGEEMESSQETSETDTVSNTQDHTASSEQLISQYRPLLEERTFDTPEEAAQYLINAISNADFYAALSAFSVASSAANLDFSEYIDRIGAFTSQQVMPEAYQTFNEVYYLNQAANSLKNFVCCLISDYGDYDLHRVGDGDTDDYVTSTELEETLDPSQLASLQCLRADSQELPQEYRKNLQLRAGEVNAEEIAPYLMLLEFDGATCYAAFEAICYDGQWSIASLNGAFVNLPAGGIAETTLEEYEAELTWLTEMRENSEDLPAEE